MEIPTAGMTTVSGEALSEYEAHESPKSTSNETCDNGRRRSQDEKPDISSFANEQVEMVLLSKENTGDQNITPDNTGVNSKSDSVHGAQISDQTSENLDVAPNFNQTLEKLAEKVDSYSKVSYRSDTTESQELTSMKYRTREKPMTVDDSSDTEDDSDNSEDSSDAESKQDAAKTINRTITSDRDFSPERKVKLNRHGFEDMRTKGELMPEELPPLEELTITVDETVEMVEVGTVASIVGVLVIVQSGANVPPLNDDTILFVEGHKVLGQVFEVFGPVKTPWYSIRFNDAGNIETKGIKPGTKVYCAPKEDSFTKFVFMDSIKRIKGSDASWEDNNEPPEKYLEFSDDEEEKRAKAKRKNKKKTGDSGGDEATDGNIQQKRNKTSTQCWPPQDDPSHRDNGPQGQGRGHNPFRGRPNQRGNSNQVSFSHRPYRPTMNHPQQEHYRYSAQTSNQSGRGTPIRFGGPPNFQNQQRFGFRKPYSPGNNQSNFNGNEGLPNINAPNFFHHNQEPVPMNHNYPPPQMNNLPVQRSTPPLRMNGPPPQMNGLPPQMNGPLPQMNGPPPQMNGLPPQMNGPLAQMNGLPHQMNAQPPYNQQRFQGPPTRPNTAPSNFSGGNDNTSYGFRPSVSNSMGQIRPNQFRVHSLNPERPPSQNEFNQPSVPANSQFDQVNLTDNVPARYRPNLPNTNLFANPTGSPPIRGQVQKQNNFTMTGNLDQQANSRLAHQMNGCNSGCQGQNTDNVENMSAFQPQNQCQNVGQNNQFWTSNNSHSSNSECNMKQVQMGKTNVIGNQNEQKGYQPDSQTGLMTLTSTQPGNHGYQPQGYDNNSTFEMRPYGNSGGFSRFQAPQPAGGMYDHGFNNKNFKNMQNYNVQAGHIVDQRFVQGN